MPPAILIRHKLQAVKSVMSSEHLWWTNIFQLLTIGHHLQTKWGQRADGAGPQLPPGTGNQEWYCDMGLGHSTWYHWLLQKMCHRLIDNVYCFFSINKFHVVPPLFQSIQFFQMHILQWFFQQRRRWRAAFQRFPEAARPENQWTGNVKDSRVEMPTKQILLAKLYD